MMEIDILLKTKVMSYMDKHYNVRNKNDIHTVINSNNDKEITPHNLFEEILGAFGLEEDFAYLITFEWLYTHQFKYIIQNMIHSSYTLSTSNTFLGLSDPCVITANTMTIAFSGSTDMNALYH